jgi:hypothetical protein
MLSRLTPFVLIAILILACRDNQPPASRSTQEARRQQSNDSEPHADGSVSTRSGPSCTDLSWTYLGSGPSQAHDDFVAACRSIEQLGDTCMLSMREHLRTYRPRDGGISNPTLALLGWNFVHKSECIQQQRLIRARRDGVCERMVSQIRAGSLVPDSQGLLPLSPDLSALSIDRRVMSWRRLDDRIWIAFTTFKGRQREMGIELCSSEPLTPEDFTHPDGKCESIALPFPIQVRAALDGGQPSMSRYCVKERLGPNWLRAALVTSD